MMVNQREEVIWGVAALNPRLMAGIPTGMRDPGGCPDLGCRCAQPQANGCNPYGIKTARGIPSVVNVAKHPGRDVSD